MKELHIVLKISERCNLACSYCYFFFGGEDSYKKHPPLIKKNIIDQLLVFIKQGVQEYGIEKVLIVLHGGEPLLMKKKNFDSMLDKMQSTLQSHAEVVFGLQTNGVLLDNEWFEIFDKYNISIGVSLDGPAEYNDKYRIDKKGKGSHEYVIRALKSLTQDNFDKIGVLGVINKDFSAKTIYDHFIHDLGFDSIDALLPDFTHDDKPQDVKAYGYYLCELLDTWIQHDNDAVSIRICKKIMDGLLGKGHYVIDTTSDIDDTLLCSISSDGTICYDDTLKAVIPWEERTIFNTKISDYLASNEFTSTYKATHILPKYCQSCCWKNICQGGRMINRYSSENKFDNPSVLCEGHKIFYAHTAKTLLNHGVSRKTIEANLI